MKNEQEILKDTVSALNYAYDAWCSEQDPDNRFEIWETIHGLTALICQLGYQPILIIVCDHCIEKVGHFQEYWIPSADRCSNCGSYGKYVQRYIAVNPANDKN